MKKRQRLILIIVGVAMTTSFLYAADGGEQGTFLKRGMGARAMALGRSYAAVADDSSAVYWNPAGLVQMKGPEISSMYSEPYLGTVEGIGYHTVSFAQPIGGGVLGAGLVYLSVNEIEKYDESGEYEGTFQDIEKAFFLSYGHQWGDKFSLGASLKAVHQEIDKYSGTGFGLDVGGLYRLFTNLKLGLMFQDLIGPTVDLAGEGEPFPLKAHLGLTYRMDGQAWLNESAALFTLGAVGTSGRTLKPKGGLEFQITRFLAIRGGYDGGSEEVGIGVGIGAGVVRLDYSYNTHRLLKETHQVSLSVRY